MLAQTVKLQLELHDGLIRLILRNLVDSDKEKKRKEGNIRKNDIEEKSKTTA